MRALRIVVGVGGPLILVLAIAVFIFVGVSALVLYVSGRLLPLAGRRRKD